MAFLPLSLIGILKPPGCSTISGKILSWIGTASASGTVGTAGLAGSLSSNRTWRAANELSILSIRAPIDPMTVEWSPSCYWIPCKLSLSTPAGTPFLVSCTMIELALIPIDRILMIPIYFTQFTLMLSPIKCLIDQLEMINLQNYRRTKKKTK